jgi:pyruvate,water dikinase
MTSPTRRGRIEPISAEVDLPPEAGGKAQGLLLIARAGLPVPPAWVVLTGADPAEVASLGRSLEARGLRSVAVRSSAEDEDGVRASFAGVHDSQLAVPPSRLLQAVEAVAASAISQRAASYRRQLGLPRAARGCAVVVQEMVDADAAGVAFGRGPEEVGIEAVEGLGTAAVNGEATPELLILRSAAGAWAVARRQRRRQREALRAGPEGPVVVALPEERQRAELLSGDVAGEIAAGVRALEAAAGRPLDVEWAISSGRVAFLQARAQTRPLSADLPPGEGWTRANTRDIIPDLPCAFTRAHAVAALDRGARLTASSQGVRPDPSIPLAANVHGRVVFNERTFLAVGDALGLGDSFRAWVRSFAGGRGGSNEVPAMDRAVLLRHPIIALRNYLWARSGEASAREYLIWLRGARGWRATDGQLDDAALLDRIRTNPAIADTDRWVPIVAQLIASIAAGNMLARPLLGGLDAAAMLPELGAATGVSVSTRLVEDLVALAVRFKGWAGALTFLAAAPPDPEGWRSALPSRIWFETLGWLRAYGHRGPFETDVSWPRYRDDLRLLSKALEPLVRSPETRVDTAQRRHERFRASETAWSAARAALDPRHGARLRRMLRALARKVELREELRAEIMFDNAEVRDLLVELGRRLAAAGRLDSPEEVFHLELADLSRAVADPGYEVRAAVKRELARRAAWRRVDVPNRFTTEEIDAMPAHALAVGDVRGPLRGTAVSPGVAEAPVAVLRSPDEGDRMPTGAVLVAPATDPGWTPLFARAAAVVVEIGGLFSHAATVAREFGLPAVANVEGATDLLHDGEVVRVDGSRGVVEVVASAPAPATSRSGSETSSARSTGSPATPPA